MIANGALEIVNKARPFLNFVRRKGIKSFFVAVDDIWLYNYHIKEYDGIVKVVFETISFVEEKQWQFAGLEETQDQVENSIEEEKFYHAFSNPTYISK